MGANNISTIGYIGRDADNFLDWTVDDSLTIEIGGVQHDIVSITDGVGDNDKLVTQGYVDDVVGAASLALDNLVAVQINTSLLSDTPDTDSLGTAAAEWLNLYIGDAGKIFLGLGQTVEIFRSAADTLTITASTAVLLTGPLGLTGTRVSAGWFADLTVTNAIAGSITGNAATVTGFTPAGGSLTLAGADAITTTGVTGITLPTTGTLLANILEDVTPELGGELDAGAHTIGFTMQTTTGDGTTTIDWRLGNKFKFTFGAQNDTLTFTAPTNPCHLWLHIVQDGVGSREITWPGTCKWPNSIEPTLSTAAAAEDMVALWWDGANYHCTIAFNYGTP